MSPDSKNNVRNFESGLEKAFTLVELIVVITILAILGTIAFISLQGYSRDARDSKRMADLGNIKTSLELYSLKTGNFPKPDSFSTITYSGGTENVWFQGNVGDQVTTNLKSLNEKPLDPLTNDPYTYSVTQSYGEYEVLALYEGSVAYNQSPHSISPKGREVASIFPQVNAATTSLTPKIVGNYNGVFVKTPNYIIPTPSIITSAPPVSGTLRLDINNNILPPAPVSSSCNVLLGLGYTTDGMYTIDPDGAGPVPSFSTYCDMTTDGGGWTLVSMERLNGTSVDGAVGNIGTFT